MKFKSKNLFLAAILILLTATLGCSIDSNKNQVVIYTSVDQVFSEPVLKAFESETGIRVLPVYDVEATKTVGLVNRLIAEKSKPQADVFWNGEFVQTLVLKEKGLLEKYKPSGASGVPAEFVDSEGFWSGFGGRARVLLVNKNLMKPEEYPQSIMDLLDSKYKGETIGMAYPVFGTTATHAAALYAVWGKDKAKDFFKKVKEKNIQILDGNSVVRDQVAEGRLSMGMTDTDDALEAVKKGKPVEIVFLDQKKEGMGTLVIPNTVALIKNGPNQQAGKKLVDFLMSAEAEAMLLEKGWIDLPAHRENQKLARNAGVKNLKTSFQEVFSELEASKSDMQALFVR